MRVLGVGVWLVNNKVIAMALLPLTLILENSRELRLRFARFRISP